MNRTLYQWQDDNGGWQRGRLVVDERGFGFFKNADGPQAVTDDVIRAWAGVGDARVFIEPIHRTQFQPMAWVAVSKLQVAPTGDERNGN